MNKTLYERLGGAKGTATIVDDLVARHLVNPALKTRFENIKDLEHAKQMAREFFSAGAGGPVTYTGKDMRTAHKGMNISEQEYLAAMDDVMGAVGHGIVQGLYEPAGRELRAMVTEYLERHGSSRVPALGGKVHRDRRSTKTRTAARRRASDTSPYS